MSVEAAVGPHGEWSGGPSVAHPAHRFPQEVGDAPGGVGPALAQSGHQHVAGASGHGEERVIAPLAGVIVATGALLAETVGLADGGIKIKGQRSVTGSGASSPSPSQHLPAHPVQLAHVTPPEAAQEGSQRGRRLNHATQHPVGPPSAQGIGVVDAVATGQGRRHQGKQLVPGVGPARSATQVNMAANQLAQSQMVGQGDRKEQPGVGHQAVVIEGDLDAVGLLRW